MSTESGKREIDEVDDDDCIGPLPAEAVKTKKRKGKAIFFILNSSIKAQSQKNKCKSRENSDKNKIL